MNINLSAEQEQIVREVLDSGRFQSAEEVIDRALNELREKARGFPAGGGNGERDEAVREMLKFVEKNSVSLQGISIKQLIHEGHRL